MLVIPSGPSSSCDRGRRGHIHFAMIVDISTRLNAPIEQVWATLKRTDLLMHVAAPLIRFRPIDPSALPDTWSDGRFRVAMLLLEVLPLGRQWIDVSTPPAPSFAVDPEHTRCIRDNGTGDLVKVWDHWILVRPNADGSTHYRDRVEVRAGLLTPLIWLFAQAFYRHRQAHWRGLVRRGLPSLIQTDQQAT